MKPRVYIDTSVVGGYFDEEFDTITKKFFERVFDIDIRSPLEFTGNENSD